MQTHNVLEEKCACPVVSQYFSFDIHCNTCGTLCWVDEQYLGYYAEMNHAIWKCGSCQSRNLIGIEKYIRMCKKTGIEPDFTWFDNLKKKYEDAIKDTTELQVDHTIELNRRKNAIIPSSYVNVRVSTPTFKTVQTCYKCATGKVNVFCKDCVYQEVNPEGVYTEVFTEDVKNTLKNLGIDMELILNNKKPSEIVKENPDNNNNNNNA